MSIGELTFVIDKLAVVIASTLSLRKNVLQEVVKSYADSSKVQFKLLNEEEFVVFMRGALDQLNRAIKDLTGHMDSLTISAKQNLLPPYLHPGKQFLGKYKI